MEKPDQEAFLHTIREQFVKEPDAIGMETHFRDLKEWSSMQSLIVITAIDEEWGVTIKEQEMNGAQRIADIYQLTCDKVN